MKKAQKKSNKQKQQKIAVERMEVLFKLADECALSNDIQRANRYVQRARDIGMRYNVRIPKEYKRKFCKFCYGYLLPGNTSKTRINSKEKRIEVECLKCGEKTYIPYKK